MKLAIVKSLGTLSLLFIFFSNNSSAQTRPPFWDEIRNFKKQDSLQPPPKNAILFVGSSSFRFWTSVEKDLPGYAIINRGFGGSSLPDVIRYANDIIYPYQPKQVVIYCGDNDLAASDSVTAQAVAVRFQALFKMVRQKLPSASIVFVSIKPSPSRAHLMKKMETANALIKEFLSHQKNTGFVDVYHLMLNEDGTPKKTLFIQDQLHMNSEGYAVWKKAIKPFLLK